MASKKKRDQRREVRIDAIIVNTAGALVGRCVMINVSASGARLTRLEPPDAPDKFDVVLTRDGTVRRHCEVAWRFEGDVGVRFVRIPRRVGPANI